MSMQQPRGEKEEEEAQQVVLESNKTVWDHLQLAPSVEKKRTLLAKKKAHVAN